MGGNRLMYFSISIPKLILGTCFLPGFATIFCVLWSVMFDFQRSTATHCKFLSLTLVASGLSEWSHRMNQIWDKQVYNILPSVSSAIGGFTPQRYVWRICISVHCMQRFMVGIAYYNFHTSVFAGVENKKYKVLAALNSLLHLTEIFSLVCLSMISSTENGDVHEGFFVSFIVCALSYMLMTIVLMRLGRFGNGKTPSQQETVSLHYKTKLFLFKIVAFAIAVYLFYRHNAYCEPYVYSCFAAVEYLIVFTNIFFHATLYWDLLDYNFALIHKDFVCSHRS